MNDWFQDESLWQTLYPFLFSESRLADAERQVDEILQLVAPTADPGPPQVLDLACGPGTHAIELAGRGLAVTGVDTSPFLLEKARARAAERGVEVEWVEADMRVFSRPDAFHLAVNVYTSFGYFEDPEDDQRTLRHLHSNLRVGGALLMDMIGKEHLARIYEPTMSEEFSDGTLLIRRTEIRDSWGWEEVECLLVDGDSTRRLGYGHRLYSARELELALREAGFSEVRFFGDTTGSDYGPDAERLVAVASKGS